ncbi:MAG: S-layer homology domain-containing protein, partial [Nitriliruptoraceae bacterium]
IVAGYPDGTFRPGGTVTRGEVATTLARVVAAADAVPQDAPSVFTDTAGSTHAPALDALAALGIVEGNEQGEARPAEPVTRGQAAALLVRTHTVLEGEPRTPTRRWFVDTEGSTHADALDVGRDLGLVSGRDRVTADPDAGIRRDQLTSMLARLLDALARAEVELDLAEETPEDS